MAIQALDRLDPVLPLSPGRAERHGFEYYRHGTLSLYAALDTQSGKVLGKTAPRHTSQEFVGSSQRWSNGRRRGRSTSFWTICRRKRVSWFAIFWRRIRTCISTSRRRISRGLNQVEIWCSKVERDVDCSMNLYQREGSGLQASLLYQLLLSER
jgi:hypothetical protein